MKYLSRIFFKKLYDKQAGYKFLKIYLRGLQKR